jgi:hypothetical protein
MEGDQQDGQKHQGQSTEEDHISDALQALATAAFSVRMDWKERIQLAMSSTAATPVSSSNTLASVRSAIFKEVITMRQKPSKLLDVLRICGDLELGMR